MLTSKFPIYAVGIMSGTSVDGVDAVVLKINGDRDFEIYNSTSQDYPADIKSRIRKIIGKKISNASQSENLDLDLAKIYGDIANGLLTSLSPETASVIGCHGQTVHHKPDGDPPFSLQIGNGQFLAEITGLPTVSDFRRADIMAGGQGAPLAPGFHQAAFSNNSKTIAVVNIGGISNITVLPAEKSIDVIGFDTGPGNTLIDYWCRARLNCEYDNNGDMAKSGELQLDLLDILLKDFYFNKPSPKSTGVEYFNQHWLNNKLSIWEGIDHCSNIDVLTTLTALTAKTISAQLNQFQPQIDRVYVCGGGRRNSFLVDRIKEQSGHKIESTQVLGIDPQLVEAAAFAWMAYQTMDGLPSTLPSVTGATKATIAGSICTPNDNV